MVVVVALTEWTLEAVVVAMMILMREGRTTLLTGVAVLHPPGTLIGIATEEGLEVDLIGTNHPEIATEDSAAVEDFETAMTEMTVVEDAAMASVEMTETGGVLMPPKRGPGSTWPLELSLRKKKNRIQARALGRLEVLRPPRRVLTFLAMQGQSIQRRGSERLSKSWEKWR